MDIALWILAVLMIIAGVAGTVLPWLPGVVLVLAGVALAAWIDDFARISGWTVGVLAVLTGLAVLIDYLAGVAGAQRAGASRLALAGAAIGTVAGVFTGLWGLVFMPLAGAAIGEYLALKDLYRAGRVGLATWLGMIVGGALKVAIALVMVGIFVGALIL
ncbi:MAG: DUF456 family protein [Burkholderiales bacterium]|nr:DUF456 family protein [Burkholderiales bacterium]